MLFTDDRWQMIRKAGSDPSEASCSRRSGPAADHLFVNNVRFWSMFVAILMASLIASIPMRQVEQLWRHPLITLAMWTAPEPELHSWRSLETQKKMRVANRNWRAVFGAGVFDNVAVM